MYAYTAGCLLYLDIGTAQKSKRLFHLKPVKIIYKGVAGSLLKQDAELALSQGCLLYTSRCGGAGLYRQVRPAGHSHEASGYP